MGHRAGASVVLCLLAVAWAPSPSRASEPRPLDVDAVRRLEVDGGPGARVSLHRGTGAVRFLRVAPGSLALSGATPEARSEAFFARHGAAFGVRDAAADLRLAGSRRDRLGFTHLLHRQLHRGVPVFAGTLRSHFDAQGRLTAVNGTFVPGLDVDPSPARSAADAVRVAERHVRGQFGDGSAAGVTGGEAQLVVLHTALLQPRWAGRAHLAWRVEVTNGRDVREFVFVDAHTGKVVEQLTGIHETLARRIHEPDFDDDVIWTEGDALPFDSNDANNDEQVNGLIETAAAVYGLFSVLSGGTHLSWDGADGIMHSVWNASFVDCPNATWNGTSTNYCDGVASDDVVAHEWTHGFTEGTHDLIYRWQPGALNEAYSDMFGEVVDVLNGSGTDTPGAPRSTGDCSTFGGNPPPVFEVTAPPQIAGAFVVSGAAFNPDPPTSVSGLLQRVNDGNASGATGNLHDGCQAAIGFVAGRVALVDRGNCTFVTKVQNAQSAGASGVIVVNSENGTFLMGGSSGSITIPSLMLGKDDGEAIAAALGGGSVTVAFSIGEADAVSVRWLMGEDSPALGGAIRDLWNPNCFGDPGRVSDVLYYCGTADGGGVHINSGVPNHAFALLVDGGTYNGRTVSALGRTRAAHLYWRAMKFYQVPDTDFADHADALAQSCSDLIGADLADLATGASSGQTFAQPHCDAVAEALLAVELALEPVQCGFEPLLDAGAPAVDCGAVSFADDFESDPVGTWSLDNSGVFAEYVPRDWAWTGSVPEGGTGSSLFALDDIDLGNCIEGDDDQSGVMRATSPPFVVTGSPLLAFDHYVATEGGADGGNVKIRVNAGAFQPIDPADFVFNAYNTTLTSAGDGNTNPLAGEPAWSGTDGGQVAGSWGRSVVDLGGYVADGDTVRLRFDFGVDGCNGLDGWYVDNVSVCVEATPSAGFPSAGASLAVARGAGGTLDLSWGASCLSSDTDFALYEGTIGDFASHAPKLCSTGGATSANVSPASGNAYYLVVPRSPDREGSYGLDGAGAERPPSTAACFPQSIVAGCH